MINYNERLDETLDKFFDVPYPDYNMGILPDEDGYDAVKERRNYEESYARDEAKQAITSLTKELVAEAKPEYNSKLSRSYFQANPDHLKAHKNGYRLGVREFEQNLLKALEYK